MALDEQETTPSFAIRQRNKKLTTVSTEHVEPCHGDAADPGIHDNRIGWLFAIASKPVAQYHGHLGPGGEIVSRSRCQLWINLDCCHAALPANNLCEDGTVIATSGSNMHDMLSGRKVEFVEQSCPQARLAVIDTARFVECN
jgi:hypothetical protein